MCEAEMRNDEIFCIKYIDSGLNLVFVFTLTAAAVRVSGVTGERLLYDRFREARLEVRCEVRLLKTKLD